MSSRSKNPRSSDLTEGHHFITFMIMVIGFIMIVIYFIKDEVIAAWLLYARMEAYIVLYTNWWDLDLQYQAARMIQWTREVNPDHVSYDMYVRVRTAILGAGYHQYVLMVPMLIIGIYRYRKWASYRGIPTVEGIIATERKVWPTLEYLYRCNPLKEFDEMRGVGRYMISPFVYVSERACLKGYKEKNKADRFLSEEKLKEELIKDLGRQFTSFQDLTGTEITLVALILGKDLEGKYRGYQDMLRFVAIKMADIKRDPDSLDKFLVRLFQPVAELLDTPVADLKSFKAKGAGKPFVKDLIREALANQAAIQAIRKKEPYAPDVSAYEWISGLKKKNKYVTTLLANACRIKKRNGKFPACRLVFFKPWNRKLYLIISNTPYYLKDEHSPYQFISGFSTEVLGIFGHLQHELYAGRAIREPMVYTAVGGITNRLKKQNFIP